MGILWKNWAYGHFVEKLGIWAWKNREGKKLILRPKSRWKNIIKTDLYGIR